MRFYATPFRCTFDATLLIGCILLLRRILRNQLHPVIVRKTWMFVVLRILIPVQIPLYRSLYTRLQLEDFGKTIERRAGIRNIEAWLAIDRANAMGESASGLLRIKAFCLSGLDRFLTGHSLTDVFIRIGQTGSVVCLLLFIIQNILFYRHIHRRSSIYGVKDELPVYIIEDYGGSCLTGIANPRIYVSRMALSNPEWCQWIVKHELGHYRSGDNWYGLFFNICLILQWYNPFMWCAVHSVSEDCELACDYRVLKGAGRQECAEYGRCLIGMASGGFSKHLTATASHLGKTSLKRRIKQIACYMEKTSQTMTGSYIFISLIGCLYVLCVTGG